MTTTARAVDVAAIETAGLAKDYGGGHGLHGLDLVVRPGEVFGFLGPNGAGKTTAIRLLMGLLRPTGGTARVLGLDCWRDAVAVKRHTGYLPGELPDWGGLRLGEVLAQLAALRGGVDPARIAALCDRLDLDLAPRWRACSRGTRQKAALVAAVAHRPDLLVLDEPTGGLDPLHQRVFHELVAEARSGGAAVFLSSHVLAEVEQVCDRVGIVRDGHLVEEATLGDLRARRAHRVTVTCATPPAADALRALPGVGEVTVTGHRVACVVAAGPGGGATGFGPLLHALAGAGVTSLESRVPSLEELFLAYYRADGSPGPGTDPGPDRGSGGGFGGGLGANPAAPAGADR